jgi:MerR family transcriptional regulator, copper efflux regulator
MQAMQRTLRHLVQACHGDARPDCPILDDLAGGGERPDATLPAPAPTREPPARAKESR